MNCLTHEQFVQLALELNESDGVRELTEHVKACSACASQYRCVESMFGQVTRAHDLAQHNHDEQRRRLLKALANSSTVVPLTRPDPIQRKATFMRMSWISTLAVSLLVFTVALWPSLMPTSAVAQTAKAMRDAKSFSCRITIVAERFNSDEPEKIDGTFYWHAPGSYRIDEMLKDKLIRTVINPKGKPGLEIDHKDESFRRSEAESGKRSPLLVLAKLPNYSGQADRELKAQKFGDKSANGFEISMSKIDPYYKEGAVRVWADPDTKRPIAIELEVHIQGKVTMRFDEFKWDVPTDKLFDVEPPARYADRTPTPANVEEITESIVLALQNYNKYRGGYPQYDKVYGDVVGEELRRAAGVADKNPDEKTDGYVAWMNSIRGFGHINVLQRRSDEAVFYGKTVGPKDKDKILFRWKLADGGYRVIFGDLRAETVLKRKLKELEAKK
jgi:outer membrane lipoprotein-sorting protein